MATSGVINTTPPVDDFPGSPPSSTDKFSDLYRWSADSLGEFVVLAVVDELGYLRTISCKDLAAKWGNLSSGWQYKNVRSGIKECQVGIWDSGRVYLTYSTETFNTTNAFGTTYFKCSSDFCNSWETEQTSSGYATVGTEPSEQPYQAKYNGTTGKYEYVKSQNVLKGTDYFVRGYAQNNLYSVTDRVYPVTVGGSTVYRVYQAGNSDEKGVAWQWTNNHNALDNAWIGGNHNGWSDYRNRYSTRLDSYTSQGIYHYPDGQPALLEDRIMADAIVASPPVKLSNGTYARLVWTNKQRKIRRCSETQFTLETDYTTPVMPHSRNFTLDIPTSSIDAEKVTFYYNHSYSTRAIIEGEEEDNKLPTSVQFSVPSWINWADLTLSGSILPSIRFRYKGADGLRVRLGTGTTQGKSYAVDGRGIYNYLCTALSSTDYATIAAGGTPTMPLIVSDGTYEEIEVLEVNLQVRGIYAQPRETWAVAHQTLAHTTYAFESDFQTLSLSNRQMPVLMDTGTYSSSLLTWMNSNKGTSAPLKTVIDKPSTVTSAWPLLVNVNDFFAVFQYTTTQADFYLLTSLDGKYWSYANDGAAISHTNLDHLKGWNRAAGNTIFCPSLVAAGDILLMAWLENGAIAALGSVDSGSTWSD